MPDDIAELRKPGEVFPVDVARKPRQLDAYQFSNYDNPDVTFGMNQNKTARILRNIADRVESGEYILQSGGVFTYAQRDNYVMSVVNVKFHAKKVASE